MPSYLLVLLAFVSRIVPHPWHFTAVGGSLLYFGARRPLRQAVFPVALMAFSDYYLTAHVYSMQFRLGDYALTWMWYAAAIVLGSILLKKASVARVLSAVALSSTSFFVVSNFAVWSHFGTYPHTLAGLIACYVAALPFWPNEAMSTLLVTGLAFGLPAAAKQISEWRTGHNPAAS
jgi:hypothetical protein